MIKLVGFDADDTLWENQIHFLEVERRVEKLLLEHASTTEIQNLVNSIERKNNELYGFGIKKFVLSMIEVASTICPPNELDKIVRDLLEMGQILSSKPVILIDGAIRSVEMASEKFTTVLITKGDLHEQKKKLEKSGLERLFDYIEVVPTKDKNCYRGILNKYSVRASSFVMIGNSMASDILPVLELGAKAIYVPHRANWAFDEGAEPANNPMFANAQKISDVPGILESWHFNK